MTSIARREFMRSAAGLACTALTTATPEKAFSQTASGPKRDYSSKPFRQGVALGDSITAGSGATSRELCWVSRLASSVNESQSIPLHLINAGIGGNVLSPHSMGYDASGRPSAMERYSRDVIEHRPDLVTICYGVNDARAGTPVGQFLDALRPMVTDIKSKTGALVILLSTHFMTAFDQYPPFTKANVAVFQSYNCGMKRLAEELDALYADIFSALACAPWTVDSRDGVHPNDLGHKMIADCVFTTLAQHCSCLSQRARELEKAATT